MKKIKQLDRFLLERFPLIWHTKIVYVLFFSVITSLFFYIWGVTYTTNYLINNFSVSRFIEHSNAMLFLVILWLIGIIVWSLSFFRKSAIRHFYPLQRFYLTRLFGLFVIIFWSFSWPLFSFQWGVNHKVRELAPQEELKAMISTINLSQVLLGMESPSYRSYLNMAHPEVQIISYDKNSESWSNSIKIIDSSMMETGGKLSSPFLTDYHPGENLRYTDTVNRQLIQFVTYKNIVEGNPCNRHNYDYVTGWKKYADLVPYKPFDLRLCKNQLIQPNKLDKQPISIFNSYYFSFYGYRHSYRYYDYSEVHPSREFNREVVDLFNSENTYDKGKQVLDRYARFLSKHEVRHSLKTDSIWSYVLSHADRFIVKNPVSGSAEEPDFISSIQNHYNGITEYEKFRASQDQNYYHTPMYFVANTEVSELYENAAEVYAYSYSWYIIISSLFAAVILAFVFLLFSIGNIIHILIAVPIGGVLIILNVFFFLFVVYDRAIYGVDSDFRVFSQMLVFAFILYSLLFIFYRSKKVSKAVLNIAMYLCFVAAPIIPFIAAIFFDLLLTEKATRCYETYRIHTSLFYVICDPLWILLIGTGFIVVFTAFIKPILSKPE